MLKNKTKQNKTKQQRKKKKWCSEIRNIEKITKQEKTNKTRILGVNSLFLLFCQSSANSVSFSVY